MRHMRSETWQQCNLSRPKDNLGSCLRGPTPTVGKCPPGAGALRAKGEGDGPDRVPNGCAPRPRARTFLPRWEGEEQGGGERGDGRPTHPHCRTVCHCSRPSCRRHARRLPGHSIAGAHRLRAPPEESPPDGTVSRAYPTLGGRGPAGSGPRARVEGGAPSPPGTPRWLRVGPGVAAALRIRARGRRAQRCGEPAPRGRPEVRRAAAAGSPSDRPGPPAAGAEPRSPAWPPPPGAPARSRLPPGRARRPLVASAPSEQRPTRGPA